MAKGQRRTNREAKKPKKTAAEKSMSVGNATPGALSGSVSKPVPVSSYKDRFK